MSLPLFIGLGDADESGAGGASALSGVLGICFCATNAGSLLAAPSSRLRDDDADNRKGGASNGAAFADDTLGDGDDGTDCTTSKGSAGVAAADSEMTEVTLAARRLFLSGRRTAREDPLDDVLSALGDAMASISADVMTSSLSRDGVVGRMMIVVEAFNSRLAAKFPSSSSLSH